MNDELKLKDGTIIPYQVCGEGQPIVFIHGLFGKSQDYNEVIKSISKEYCCVSFDLRGHGQSKELQGINIAQYATDLKALIDHLKLINPVIVGYSTGALALFNYIELYGCENISKLVFVDITPKIISDQEWSLGLYRGEYTEKDFQQDLSDLDNKFLNFASYFTYRNMTKYKTNTPYRRKANLLSKVLARVLIGKSPQKQLLTKSIWKELGIIDFRNTLNKIKVPSAFFYADPGSLFSPKTAHYMKDTIGEKAIAVPFMNASHALLFSHGKQFANELKSFLKN
ncbi:alpha/beta fold hydrolase [Gottfriedia sp. NPDC056225]|uniref:alpha/beta fold hydrolase n=1 Tax=Gottfriedia sp. NPDC056225 TaxID=3345751 RepID=UPI0035E22CEF